MPPTRTDVRSAGGVAKGALAITASALGFAVMAALVRLSDDFGSPLSTFQKSFFRNVVAFAIALVVFFRRGQGVPRIGASTTWLLILRSVLGTCGLFTNFYALSHVPIAEGQTLNKTAPFFTVICAWLFLGEKAKARQIIPLVIAFAGVLFVVKPGFADEAAFPLAIGLLGGVCAGSAYACLRALRRREVDSSFIVMFFSAFSCFVSIPFAAATFTPMTPAQVAILFGAGAGAALGQFGITAAYGFAAPRDIAVYDYSSILFAAVLGYAMFGQMPDAWSVLGFVFIVFAALRLHRGTAC